MILSQKIRLLTYIPPQMENVTLEKYRFLKATFFDLVRVNTDICCPRTSTGLFILLSLLQYISKSCMSCFEYDINRVYCSKNKLRL